MKISELLKSRGMFSNDIKSRFKNKQMALDGDVLEQDIDINVDHENIIDAGDFIFDHIVNDSSRLQLCKIVGFENLFGCNIENDFIKFLNQFHVLRISKRDLIILKKCT